ncbi:MAG: substrate-binding domain-containing protein [Alphaproteobacteria bacterium]|nr:substrate-binding domain-containing protein [Alphaproteobacteria bacterium]
MATQRRTLLGVSGALALGALPGISRAAEKTVVYLTPGLDLPFWRYLAKGIEDSVKAQGFGFSALDSHNNAATQLKNAQDVIARGVAGICISPTDSSTAPAVLGLAQRAKIPVIISDIGTNSGEYVSFVISNNFEGAYGIGKVLAERMKEKGWQNGSVGFVTISQARRNGQARTAGFRKALKEAGITKEAGLQQMQSYTADETFHFVQDMLTANPDMRGLFVQTDQPTTGALRAIKAARREGQVLVASYDGTPELVKLIEADQVVGSGMQQPYLMGVKSAEALLAHLKGESVPKETTVPILVVTSKNVAELLPTIRKTVFAGELS